MKKCWTVITSYGRNFVVCYSREGKELEYYSEPNDKGRMVAKAFSFADWLEGIPQFVCKSLNEALQEKGEFTPYVANINQFGYDTQG